MSNHSDGPGGTVPGGVERRRYPRVVPPIDLTIDVPQVIDAEMLDISSGGALVSASMALAPGQRAQLRMLLAREPFIAWVEVVRAHPGTMHGRESRYRLGVRFISVDDSSRRTLLRFVRDDRTNDS